MIRHTIAISLGLLASTTLAVPTPVAATAASTTAPEPINGSWKTEDGRAVVAITRCGANYCGRISRFLVPEPAGGAKDTENPNRNLRSRDVMGLRILWNLGADGGDWEGNGYSPEDGRYFTAKVRKLSDNRLEVKGCVAVFCRTQTWSRM